jgi:hypothetical protein
MYIKEKKNYLNITLIVMRILYNMVNINKIQPLYYQLV